MTYVPAGEYAQWASQVNRILVTQNQELEALRVALAQLTARVERLDTSAGVAAGELFAAVDRLDGAAARAEVLEARLTAHVGDRDSHGRAR
jgi:hypothetical protein